MACYLSRMLAKEKIISQGHRFLTPRSTRVFEREDAPFNRLFEPGHHDTLNHGSVAKAIEFIQELGAENCFNALQAIKGECDGCLFRARFN